MFGYVTPLKNELKIGDYEYFKSYYHGLCYTIKEKFGNIPRLTLSYDMTFIGFLLDGLYQAPLKFESKRCIKHPTSLILAASKTIALEYVANLSILFFNYKLKDNIRDDNSFKSRVFYLFLSPKENSIDLELASIENIIKEGIDKLSLLETNKQFSSIDEISHPFAHVMGSILKDFPYEFDNDSIDLRQILYQIGYNIGKYIYLIDALDDLKEDIVNNKFNPISTLYNKKCENQYKEIIEESIYDIDLIILNSISICKESLEKITFYKHTAILDNVFNLGMLNQYYEILARIKKEIPL